MDAYLETAIREVRAMRKEFPLTEDDVTLTLPNGEVMGFTLRIYGDKHEFTKVTLQARRGGEVEITGAIDDWEPIESFVRESY